MLDISLAYTWSVCWLYMAAWGLVWEVVTNTQHDTVCSLCQQLKRLSTSEIFGYELLRAPVLFTHVASHAEYEPVRSSRILDQRCQNKSDLPCCPGESNIIRPQKLSHLHLWGSRPLTSLELEWEMSECLYFLYQWSLMLYETLWCFDKVPRQPSKTMSKKKLLTTTAAWHGPMCPSHDFLSLHNSEKSVVANGCKLGRVKHA